MRKGDHGYGNPWGFLFRRFHAKEDAVMEKTMKLEIPETLKTAFEDMPKKYVGTHFMKDSAGRLRIRSGRIDCEATYSIISKICKGMKDAEIEALFGMPQSTVSQVRTNRRICSFSDEIVAKMIAQAGKRRFKGRLEDEILAANGTLVVTGRPDVKKFRKCFDGIRKVSGMNAKAFGDLVGLGQYWYTNARLEETRRKPFGFPILTNLMDVRDNCGVTAGMLLAANYCGPIPQKELKPSEVAAEQAEADAVQETVEEIVEETVVQAEEQETVVSVAEEEFRSDACDEASDEEIEPEAKIRRKEVRLPSETVLRIGDSELTKAVSSEMVNAVRGAFLLGRDLGIPDGEMDEAIGRLNSIAADSLEARLLAAYRAVRLADADEGKVVMTKDELAFFARKFIIG